MKTYYVPPSKRELIQLLVLVYPDGQSHFKKMQIDQLYAIFFKTREMQEINLRREFTFQ